MPDLVTRLGLLTVNLDSAIFDDPLDDRAAVVGIKAVQKLVEANAFNLALRRRSGQSERCSRGP
jgi:hypothetical protein